MHPCFALLDMCMCHSGTRLELSQIDRKSQSHSIVFHSAHQWHIHWAWQLQEDGENDPWLEVTKTKYVATLSFSSGTSS